MELINALGRRKSAVARVYVCPGKGNITINGTEVSSEEFENFKQGLNE